ncbi:MAG: hypothetical protein ACSW8H_08580 [bacterium]
MKKRKKKRRQFHLPKKVVNALMVFLLVSGLTLLIYPTFANWWNQQQQDGAIVRYTRVVEAKEPEEVITMRKAARPSAWQAPTYAHGWSPTTSI